MKHEGKPDYSESDRLKMEAAAEAATRIRQGMHWRDWSYIGDGFAAGRRWAMNEAYTNQPAGRAYSEAFSYWMGEEEWPLDFDKGTRAALLWLADRLPQIEEWRETLTPAQRQQWNHPRTVKRNYEKAMQARPDQDQDKPQSPMERLKRENDTLRSDAARLKRELEHGGSDFDTVKDSVDDIARVMTERCVLAGKRTKPEKIARALLRYMKEHHGAG